MKKTRSEVSQERIRFYLLYTLIFGLFAIVFFSPFTVTGKSLIWKYDGLSQHFNAFVYLGDWVREILHNLFVEHQLIVPMWEFGIGYGADVFSTLQYYVLGDPIALLSVITPAAHAEVMYGFAIVLRLYLAGLVFCAFCRKMNCGRAASLCGAFSYAFCSYAIVAAVRHPYFVSPMIYLPLILLGAEKILRKEKPTLYILSIFVAAASNFYFFYMLVLLTILYVTFRFFSLYGKTIWKNIGPFLGKFIGYSLIGILMAGALLLPICMTYLSDARSSSNYTFDFFYHRGYYESFLQCFITDRSPAGWSNFGATPICFLGALGLILQKGEHRWLKNLYFLFVGFLLLPIAGYAFNGFGYVANRWVFGYAFVISFMFALALPNLLALPRKQKATLGVIAAIYCLVCLFMERTRQENTMASCMLLMISLAVFWAAEYFPTLNWKKLHISSHRLAQMAAFAMVLIGAFSNGFYRYSLQEGKYAAEFCERNTGIDQLANAQANVTELIDDERFFRLDRAWLDRFAAQNFLISSKISSTQAYWSLQNPNLVEYFYLNSAYAETNYTFKGLMSRSLLEPFACASYFVCDAGWEKYVPYGYQYVGSSETFEGKEVKLYRTENALPLGYTYDRWMPREKYDALSIPQRQQAMLYGAILEEDDAVAAANLKEAEPEYKETALEYSIETGGDVELDGNKITVKQPGAKITVKFTCPANTELYAQFNGLHFESQHAYSSLTQEEYDSKSIYDRKKIKDYIVHWVPANSTVITAASNGVSAVVTHFTDKNVYVHGREDYLLNLNYSDAERSSIGLSFEQPGVYTFDDFSVISQPVDMLQERTTELKENALDNINMSTNLIVGDISLPEEKLLCLSVPYSTGWTLYVDGQETELLKTNVMYMGTVLPAGDHHIELRYTTPYLKAGMILTGIGVSAFVVLMVFEKRNKTNSSRGQKKTKTHD